MGQHMNKFCLCLMRIDVNLESALRGRWRAVHTSLNIDINGYELVLAEIIRVLSTHFGTTVFNPELQYLFERIYRCAAFSMFAVAEMNQMITQPVKSLTTKQRSIISSSFEQCIRH